MSSNQKKIIKKQLGITSNYVSQSSNSYSFLKSDSYSTKGADYIARLQDGPKGLVVNYIMSSSAFNDVFREQANVQKLLMKVAKNLWETHKYNQEYISFLLGGYTEEEFLELAEKFAEEPMKDMTGQQISFALNWLSSIFKNNLSSSDLSILLNQDCSYIEQYLKESKHPTIY